MPAIPYITPGAAPTAEKWNVLFDELDRRLGLALGGRSILFGPSDLRDGGSNFFDPELFGAPFLFAVEANRRHTRAGSVNGDTSREWLKRLVPYNHSVYTNAVNNFTPPATTSSNYDHGRRILKANVFPSFGFLDGSLEAHSKMITIGGNQVRYYLLGGTVTDSDFGPQRRHRLSQSDIVVEGYGPTLEMLAIYNKYSFFRFHNLQATALTVNFRKTGGGLAHSIVVPPRGSKCVRRTNEMDPDQHTYTNGGTYFHKFKSGDYRFASIPHSDFTEYRPNPWKGMRANNVAAPLLVLRKIWQHYCTPWLHRAPLHALGETLINHTATRVRAPVIYMNPHEVHDVSAQYSGLLATPTDSALVGDCIYHKGKFVLRRIASNGVVTDTEVQFNGFATFVADMAAQGISVTVASNGDLQISPTETGVVHDAFPLTTNLLSQSGGLPVVNISNAPRAIENGVEGVPPEGHLISNVSKVTTFTVSPGGFYNVSLIPTFAQGSLVGPNVAANLRQDAVSATDIVTAPKRLRIQTHTISNLKNLGVVGTGVGNQNTINVNTYDNRAVTLTGYGLALTFTQNLRLTRPVVRIARMEAGLVTLTEAGVLSCKMRLSWNGHSWPGEFEFLMLTPRVPRIYSPTQQFIDAYLGFGQASHFHPFASSEAAAADGEDFTVPPPKVPTPSRFAYLTALPSLSNYGFLHSRAVLPVIPESFDMLNYLSEANYLLQRDSILTNTAGLVRAGGKRYALTVPLTFEHYNNAAAFVNAMEYAKPAEFKFNGLTQVATGSGYDYLAVLKPNQYGVFGTTIRPKNQYGSFGPESVEYKACLALGIPILTPNDFPESYGRIINTDRMEAAAAFTPRIETENPSFPRFPFANFEFRANGKLSFGQPCGAPDDAVVAPGYFWVTIESVRAKAAELGIPFVYETVTHPLDLEVFDVTELVDESVWGLPSSYDAALVQDPTYPREFINASGTVFSSFDAQGAGTTVKIRQTPWFQTRFAGFITARSLEDCDWVCDQAFPRQRTSLGFPVPVTEYHLAPSVAPDVLTSYGNNLGRMYHMKIQGPAVDPEGVAWRRQLGGICVRGDTQTFGVHQVCQASSVLVQNHTVDAPRNSKVVLQARGRFMQHCKEWSLKSYQTFEQTTFSAIENARFRLGGAGSVTNPELQGNTSKFPVTAVNAPSSSTPTILGFAADETEKFLTWSGSDADPALAVILWQDNRVNLL